MSPQSEDERRPETPGPLVTVSRNDDASRFEGRVGEELVGVIDYRVIDGALVVIHTGTEPDWRGRGVAGELTRQMLDDARSRGERIRPVCPYTERYLDEHTEYADLLG